MIEPQSFRALLAHQGFQIDAQSVSEVLRKSFAQNDFELVIDFTNQKIISVKANAKILEDNLNTLSIGVAKGLNLLIPSWEVQEELAIIADQAKQALVAAQTTIAAAPAQKQAILNKYL